MAAAAIAVRGETLGSASETQQKRGRCPEKEWQRHDVEQAVNVDVHS